MTINADQIRAARALKNWSQSDLANHVGMATPSIGNIEAGKHNPTLQTQIAIIGAFEDAGIEFIDGGVRHQPHTVKVLTGHKGFAAFRTDVLNHAKSGPLDICVSNVDERQFDKWGKGDVNDYYFLEMKQAKGLSFRILVHESDDHLVASDYASYRWLPDDMFGEISFYVYAGKVAIISFEENTFSAFIIKHPRIANFYRREFDRLWEKSFEQKLEGT